eukprot:gene17760-24763_t
MSSVRNSLKSDLSITDQSSISKSYKLKPSINATNIWCCHCCTAKNYDDSTNCRVCGRPESYAQEGYQLPFHGNSSNLFRPSQIVTVLDSINEVDTEGWTALHNACVNNNYRIAKELLKFGADPNSITEKGQSALHIAVHGGAYECVKELIKYGAEVNKKTGYELSTPLHIACENGQGKITEILLENGAEVNSINLLERTPLHCVAVIGRIDIAKLLLRNDAKIGLLDRHGWTAGQIAELFHHRQFQELLIRENMTEKQVVLKELPTEKWHSSIWNDVIRLQTKRRNDHNILVKQEEEEVKREELLREIKLEEIRNKLRHERKIEIAAYNADKLPIIPQR